MLNFTNLSLYRGTKRLLDQTSALVFAGQKVGIVGENGAGKSSLFALIRGELTPDAGDFTLPVALTIAHVAQETPALARSALDYVMDGDAELRSVQAELIRAEEDHDGNAIARLHAKLDAIDAWTAEARAGELLHGLGFAPDTQRKLITEFSGGWRMRLNLAQALMCRSDILLLDEPTNHLDLEAVVWLEEWLKRYPGTLLIISHDRDFLDNVVTHILHFDQAKLVTYSGNYSGFERQRAERLAQQQVMHERQQRQRAHLESYINRFKAQATKAKQAQSRIKALERMELIAEAHVDSQFHFSFREPVKAGNPLLKLSKAELGYGDRTIVAGVNFSLAPGSRISLLGENGAGKSTLVKTLAGEIAPRAGVLEAHPNLTIGYFAQHQLELLDPKASAYTHILRLSPNATEQEIRDHLGGFGFHGDNAMSPVAPFSGGEKARLVLAMLVWQRPNLLLLDEPTNHLDLDMRQALTQALTDYEGALVLVSHDRHLLRAITDEFMFVGDGKITPFDGDLDDYQSLLAERRREKNRQEKTATPAGGADNAGARKDRRRQDAELRQLLSPLTNRAKKLEQQLAKLESEKAAITGQLADPALYEAGNKDKLKTLLARETEVKATLEDIELEWLSLQEEIENLQKT